MVAAVTSALLACVLPPGRPQPPGPDAVSVAPARKDADGVMVHEVRSPYQAGTTLIRVHLDRGGVADLTVNGKDIGAPGNPKSAYVAPFEPSTFRPSPDPDAGG